MTVCTPHYNTECKSYFTRSMLQAAWPKDTQITFLKSMGQWTPGALKMFVDKSRELGADHMTLISVDTDWDSDTVAKLVSHDKDVISGWSSGRYAPFRCHVAGEIFPEKRLFKPIADPQNHHGLEKVSAVGGELVVYNMSIFDKLPSPWFFGPDMVKSDKIMTEDYFFAVQAWKHGVEIWCDWDVDIRHCADGIVTSRGKLVSL